MNFKRDIPTRTYSGFAISALLILTILNILLQIGPPTDIERAGDQLLAMSADDGVANAVTSVVVYFRGFDTLGEIAVLFIAALGIGMMLTAHTRTTHEESNYILKKASRMLFPMIMLFGVYVMVYGHLSPGGGFQGGVIIASGVLLLLISREEFEVPHSVISALETFAGVSYVLIGLIGLLVVDKFLGNFLPNNISQMGMLFSGGVIPLIYIVVGIKVGSEMSMIVQNLIQRSDDD